MAERDDYPLGTPSWVDLTTPDLDGALRFYGALFGWEFEDTGEEAGHYHMALVDGRRVAGLGPAQEGAPPSAYWTTSATLRGYQLSQVGERVVAGVYAAGADPPPHWLTYFALDDVDAGFERVRENGGQVLREPVDSPYGRYAPVQDPQGAGFCLIQPANPSP